MRSQNVDAHGSVAHTSNKKLILLLRAVPIKKVDCQEKGFPKE
jgi:hypothetical protein